MVSEQKWNKIIFGVGIFCFAFGISMGIAWPYIYELIVKQLLQFQPSSQTYKMWKDAPIPIYMDFFLFNWTNSEEFEKDPTVVPHFDEVGPFTFEEVHDRVNIVWDDDNYLVTFNETRTWYFVPEESADLSLKVTTINPLALSVAYMARVWDSELWKIVVNTMLNKHEKYFTTATASQWLFDGYDDEFLRVLLYLRNLTYIEIPYNRFAWFYERNQSATYDGIFTMKTGVDDIYNLGLLESWNNMKNTSYFDDQCSMVRGSTGEVIPPMKEFEDKTTVFSSDMCSYVSLYYDGETSFEGVKGYEYVGDERMFDNGQNYSENSCFCTGECTPSGARNISLCRYKTPAFVSLPHFYAADYTYTENITGMNASEEEHKFILKFQPDLGIPMEVRAALQVNLLLEPSEKIDLFKNSPRLYVPMMWFRQRAKLSSDLAWLLNLLLMLPDIGIGVFYAIAGIGFVMVFGRFIYVLRRHQKKTAMKVL